MKNNRKLKYTSEMGYNPNTGLNKDIFVKIETYNEEVKESLNLYVNTWFMAFINKQVTEESEKVLVR